MERVSVFGKYSVTLYLMDNGRFIQVILPLKLEWEPYYRLPEGMSVAVGERVGVVFAHRHYIAVVSGLDCHPTSSPDKILDIEGVETGLPSIGEREIAFWRQVANYYLCSVGEVYKAAYPSVAIRQEETEVRVRQQLERRKERLLEKIGKAKFERTRQRYQAELEALENQRLEERPPQVKTLSEAQQKALGSIKEAFAKGKTVLLHGVTGSGKTEIYLNLAAQVLAEGKSVLFLVPEIALSRQLEERVSEALPEVMVYHSAESAARRREVADRIREADACCVLGTRSALFLPHRNLGLIIVDEEHDRSYKQDSPAPRYNAREAAIMLAICQDARVLLGSATPSLESLYNADTGRFAKVELKERFYKGEEAELMIIDTAAERRKNGMAGSFSLKLLAEIHKTLEQGKQVALLRARRSYAPAVQCSECGKTIKCPHCNVSLSLHRNPERLVCHYCGHTQAYSAVCPDCGGALVPLGGGTQKIAEELQAFCPQARIARLDSDTPPKEEAAIIKSFAKAETDILIGTQMVTKGFDFSGLSLVAVLQADSILAQQDFRADERAIQLFEQFRGRSGRRGSGGLFVIQTREPGHHVFSRLKGEDDTAAILEERRTFGYPPYSRMIQLIFRDGSEKRIDYLSKELAEQLESSLEGVSVVGPYSPAVDRIADQYIRHIRIILPRDKRLSERKEMLVKTISIFEKEYKYPGHIVVDVDPV